MAPGYVGIVPDRQILEQFCNLGYAAGCDRLPQAREWDAVRFAVIAPGKDASGSKSPNELNREVRHAVQLNYVCERAHRPVEHGKLEFDVTESRWLQSHANCRVQRMAECFLEEYLATDVASICVVAHRAGVEHGYGWAWKTLRSYTRNT